MIGQRFSKSAVYGKGAAPVAVFFAIGNQSRILIEFINQRFKYTVAVLINLVLGNRLAVLKSKTLLFSNLLYARILLVRYEHIRLASGIQGFNMPVGEHNIGNSVGLSHQIHIRRNLRIHSQLYYLGHFFLDIFQNGLESVLARYASLDQLCAVSNQRIYFLPCSQLFFCAVAGSV